MTHFVRPENLGALKNFGFRAAVGTSVADPLFSEDSEQPVVPAACTDDVSPPAGVAENPVRIGIFELLKFPFGIARAVFCIVKLRAYVSILRLKIRVLAFAFRQLGLQEGKVLAQDRRRAMFGDQALQRVEKLFEVHGPFLS